MGWITQPSTYQNFSQRFRMINDYAVRTPGYGAGYPTGIVEDVTRGVEAVLLKDEYRGLHWEWMDVSIRDLWPPGSGDPIREHTIIRKRFEKVSDYAVRLGGRRVGGFPNVHQADYGNGVVFGTILFKTDPVGYSDAEFRNLTEAQLGMGSSAPQTHWDLRLKRTEDAAVSLRRSDDARYNYRFGLPTGHDALYNNVHLYGAICFGHGSGPTTWGNQMAERVTIPAAALPGYPYAG